MPLQNRVLATGEIVASPARGTFMGNRGILHDDTQALGRKRWAHKAWVTCVLKHKDWHRAVMSPNHYTELFFLDEAVALAAGHRPCALCRRANYTAYRDAVGLTGTAKEMDAALHAERAIPRRFAQNGHRCDVAELPDGAIILIDTPALLWEEALLPIRANGYEPRQSAPTGTVTVLTPQTSLNALRNGYRPTLHASINGS
ncbi:MAG: hypothetical protein ABJF50_06090 [Paracoccaceae bacterium]